MEAIASDFHWDNDIVRAIGEERERERAAAPNLAATLGRVLERFSKMYGEKIHYALELIQNAEDANATSMVFRFESDRLIVWNDGDPFSERDVRDITDAALSHKRNKIGFFGVGFKAVFNVTDRPQVVSGEFNFELTDFIYPRGQSELGLPDRFYNPTRGSAIVLPYSEDKVGSAAELVDAVRELDARLLLFLKHIQSVRFETAMDSDAKTWTLARSGESPVVLTNTDTGESSSWRIFRSSVRIPRSIEIPESKVGISRTYPVVGFPEVGTDTKSVRGAPLFCYLPTRRTTGLPFLVNADFVPTSGRNDIERSDWNEWLLHELGKLAGKSVLKLAKDAKSDGGLLDYVPLNDDVNDDQIRPIVDEMHNVLKGARIVPSRSGGFLTPLSTALGVPKLPALLTRRDLTRLMRRRADFPAGSMRQRDLDVIRELGAREVGTVELLKIVADRNHYPERGALWYLYLYDYLADVFEADVRHGLTWSSDTKKALWSEVTDTRLILLRDNSLARPRTFKNGRMVCYPQRGVRAEELELLFADRRIVFLHRDLQEASVLRRASEPPEVSRTKARVKEFLKNAFGVVVYLQVNHVVDKILLPMFKSGEISRYSRREIIAFTDFIRRSLSRYAQLYRKSHYSSDGTYEDLRNSLGVVAYVRSNRNAKPVVVSAWSAYLGAPYTKDRRLQRLLAPLGMPFLSAAYMQNHPTTPSKVLSWPEFFLQMGVWDNLALHPLEPYKISLEDARRRFGDGVYSTRDYVVYGDFKSPDLAELLSAAGSSPSGFDMLSELWRVLDERWNRLRPRLECTLEYFYYKTLRTQGPTEFAIQIRSLEWVPTLDGKLATPGELLQNSEENRFLLGRSGSYTRLSGKRQFLEDLGVRIQPTLDEVVNELRRLRGDPSTRGKSFKSRMSAIYSFISRHLPDDPGASEELRRSFESESLFYLPRKDRQWWSPRELFWADCSAVFGRFRGYPSLHYGEECRPLAEFLGVPDRPRIPEVIRVLKDIARKHDFGERWLGEVRRQLRSIYLYLEQLLNAPIDEASSQALESFDAEGRLLSEAGQFEPVASLCFVDDPRLHALFRDAVRVAYVPFNPSSIPRTLSHLRVASLKSLVSRSVEARHPRPLDASGMQRLREAAEAALSFISLNYPSVLMGGEAGLRERVSQLDADRVHSIVVKSELRNSAGTVLAKKRQRVEAYLDDRRWRLLMTEGAKESELAQEISTLFRGGQTLAYPVLLHLLAALEDEDEFQRRVGEYGLGPMPEQRGASPIEVLAEASDEEMGVRTASAAPAVGGEHVAESAPSTPRAEDEGARDIQGSQDALVDLSTLTSFEATEVAPEGSTHSTNVVRVTGRSGWKSSKSARQPPPVPVGVGTSTARAKAIAEHIAFRFEQFSSRHPRYVGQDEQDKEGCDIISDDRLVEVKGQIEGEGPFTLQDSQYKRAKEEGDRYYVYVVSNLRHGQQPKISLIQDPINSGKLVFERPRQWKVLEWRAGVQFEVQVSGQGSDTVSGGASQAAGAPVQADGLG